MSTFRTLRTRRQREHASQHTRTHKQDKLIGELRRSERWLLLPAARSTAPERDFGRVMETFGEYVGIGADKRVTPAAFVAHLEDASRDNRYVGEKTRNGRIGTSQRTCANPVFQIDVSLAPWVSDFLCVGVEIDPKRVEEILVCLGSAVATKLQESFGGTVLGWTVHCDTSDPHVSISCSKIAKSKDGVARLGVVRGLGLAGPWAVGVDRQRRAGISYGPHDEKFESLMGKLKTRGVATPLDVALARFLDRRCAEILPLAPWVREYRRRIDAARSQTLGDIRASLANQIAQLDAVLHAMQKTYEQPKTEPKHEYHPKLPKTVDDASGMARDDTLPD